MLSECAWTSTIKSSFETTDGPGDRGNSARVRTEHDRYGSTGNHRLAIHRGGFEAPLFHSQFRRSSEHGRAINRFG